MITTTIQGPRASDTTTEAIREGVTLGVIRDLSRGDQELYKSEILDTGATVEYILWTANNASPVWHPSWWVESPSAIIREDATHAFIVDSAQRTIATITHLIVARNGVTYTDNGWVDEEDPSQGRLGATPYDVVLVAQNRQNSNLPARVQFDDVDLADTIIDCRYTLQEPLFYWSRNDSASVRFGCKGGRWAPYKGSPPVLLGTIYDGAVFTTTKGLTDPQFRYGGTESDPSSRTALTLPDDASYDSINGTIAFNTATLAGQILWQYPSVWDPNATGILGTFSTETLVLTPTPIDDEYPLIRIGSRSYLNVIFRDTENDAHAYLQEGDVLVTRSTGTLTFSFADLAKIGVDSKYTDQFVVYDGISMTAPLSMDAIETLTVPNAMSLYEVADGSGVAPRVATASPGRRGGSGTGINPARTLAVPTHGTTAVFTRNALATNIVEIKINDDVPDAFDVAEGTVYVNLESATLLLPPSMADETTVYSRTCVVTLPDTGISFGFPAEVVTALYTNTGDIITPLDGVDRVFLAEAPLLDYSHVLTSRETELVYNQDYTYVADNDKALAWLKPVTMATTTTEPTQQISLGAPDLLGISVQTGTPLVSVEYVNQDGVLTLTQDYGAIMAQGSGGTLEGSTFTPTVMPLDVTVGQILLLTTPTETLVSTVSSVTVDTIVLTESLDSSPIIAWALRNANKIVDQNALYIDLDHTNGPTITLQRYREGFTEIPNDVNAYGCSVNTDTEPVPLTVVDEIVLGRMAATIDLSSVYAEHGSGYDTMADFYATLTFHLGTVTLTTTLSNTDVLFDAEDVAAYDGYLVTARQNLNTPVFQRWDNTYNNVEGYTYLVKDLTTSDFTCRPVSGSFSLSSPAQESDLYKATYFKANANGARTGTLASEFLTSFVTKETATRVSDHVYTFAPTKVVLDSVALVVFKGVRTMAAGVNYNVQGKELHFIDAVDSTDVVTVSYSTPSMNGGEIALTSTVKPLYSPPFFIPVGRDYVGLRGDRTSDFMTGQLIRVGSECLYVIDVEYQATPNATKVGIYPTPSTELGSRSPGNTGGLQLRTVGAISQSTCPENWTAVSLTHCEAGSTQVTLSDATVPLTVGALIEIAGIPYVVGSSNGNAITTIAPVKTTALSAYVSKAPIYPATSQTPLALGPLVTDTPFILVQGTELLTNADYSVDETTGQIRLKGTRTLADGDLHAFYTQAVVIPTGTYIEITGYGRTTTPPPTPILLTATARKPMVFYGRVLPLDDYETELATDTVLSIAYTSGSTNRLAGLPTAASALNEVNAADRIARRNFAQTYEALRGYYTVTEIMTGTLVGGLDGKFKSWIGNPSTLTPVRGYEDPVTGELLPRNAYETYMRVTGGNQRFLNEAYDELYKPSTVTVSSYTMTGTAPTPVDKDLYKLAQHNYVMNDVTDLVLDNSDSMWNPKDRLTQTERIATATVDTSLAATGTVLGAFDHMTMGMATPIVNRRVARARILAVHPTGIPTLGLSGYCIVAAPNDCQTTDVDPNTLIPTYATSTRLLTAENVLNIPGFAIGDELWTDNGPLLVFNSAGEQVTATIQSMQSGHIITLSDTEYVISDLTNATSIFAAPRSYVVASDVGVDYKGTITALSTTPPEDSRLEAYALVTRQSYEPPALTGSSLSDTYERTYPVTFRTDAEAVTLEYLCQMIPEILETPGIEFGGPMYGDEILTTATLDTGTIVLADPVTGLTGDYKRDAQAYDVVLIENGGSISGVQSIGDLVSPTEIRLPVFPTHTDNGDHTSYDLTNALVYLNDTYPSDPQATPPLGVLFEFDADATTFTFPDSTVNLATLSTLVNYNTQNLLRLTFYARTDPNITTPLQAGSAVLIVEFQNSVMTTVGAWSGATAISTAYDVFATSDHTITITHSAPSPDTIELSAPADEWYLPYAVGATTTALYGFEYSISLSIADCATTYIASDRCTFVDECVSLMDARATGTKHPLYAGTNLGLILANLKVNTPSGTSAINDVNPTFLDGGIARSVPYADRLRTPTVRVVPSSHVHANLAGTYKEPATMLTNTTTNIKEGDVVFVKSVSNKNGTYKVTGIETRATTVAIRTYAPTITLQGLTTDQNTLYTSTAIPSTWPSSGRIYIVRNAANITNGPTLEDWMASVCSVAYASRTNNTFQTLSNWKNIDGSTLDPSDMTTMTDLIVTCPVSIITANPTLALVEGTYTINSVSISTEMDTITPSTSTLTPTHYDLSSVSDSDWEILNNTSGYPITVSGYARFLIPTTPITANVTYVKGISLSVLDAPPTGQSIEEVTVPPVATTTEDVFFDVYRTKRYHNFTSPLRRSTYEAQTTEAYSFTTLDSGCGSLVVDTALTWSPGDYVMDVTQNHRSHILASTNTPVSVPNGGGGFVSVTKQRLTIEPNAHWTPQNGDTIVLATTTPSYQEGIDAMLAGARYSDVTLTGANLTAMEITGVETIKAGDIVKYQNHPYRITTWNSTTHVASLTSSPWASTSGLNARSTASPTVTNLTNAAATIYLEPTDLTKKALLLQSELTYWLEIVGDLLDNPTSLTSTTLGTYAFDSQTLLAILGDTRSPTIAATPSSAIQRRAKLNGDRRLRSLGPLTEDVTYELSAVSATPYGTAIVGNIKHHV